MAVLPAAILAAIAATFLTHWAVMLWNSSYGGTPHMMSLIPASTLEPLMRAYFVPLAFILAGAYVAPRFKLATAAALSGLIIGLMVALSLSLSEHLSDPIWRRVVTWCLWIAAIAVSLFQARRMHKTEEPSSNVTGWN